MNLTAKMPLVPQQVWNSVLLELYNVVIMMRSITTSMIRVGLGDVGVYARITIPLGAKPKARINCNELYEVELRIKKART